MRKIYLTSADFIDPFERAFYKGLNCYCFESRKSLPRLNINARSVLFANRLEPEPSDIVICYPANQTGKMIIGRFLKRVGQRVLLELPSGLSSFVLSQTVLVVMAIA
jgi:hypothetical protein